MEGELGHCLWSIRNSQLTPNSPWDAPEGDLQPELMMLLLRTPVVCDEPRLFSLVRSCCTDVGDQFWARWRLLASIDGDFKQKAFRRDVRRRLAGKRGRQSDRDFHTMWTTSLGSYDPNMKARFGVVWRRRTFRAKPEVGVDGAF